MTRNKRGALIASHSFVSADQKAPGMPALEPVIDILHESSGVDFTQYKPNTLYRRIVRRIVLHKLGGFSDYVRFLRANAGEVEALYQDILINVTSFFRNPEAFEALKNEVFPALTQSRSRRDPVRIWALGCSTGEEAYSLAMAYVEFSEGSGRAIPARVLATDLNATSIERARCGIFSKRDVQHVGAERLRRFFVEVDGTYHIAKPIRDICVFARHNVLADPLFTRVDLVSCRNLLIYLAAELQRRVIAIMHSVLHPHGFLWLGTSETIGTHRDLFELTDPEHRIYARKSAAAALPARAPGEPRPSGGAVSSPRVKRARAGHGAAREIARLRRELAETREYFQSVIQLQDAANEKLQSVIEQMQSANAELQNINDALATSRDEVQSSNEELAAVTERLHAHNAELAHANNDLTTLLAQARKPVDRKKPVRTGRKTRKR